MDISKRDISNRSLKKVSVIVPVYNTEKFVERCIRSILNQTYDNLEVLCVDDGSTDQSGLILDRLSKEDSRLHVIHNLNNGVGISRNLAMQEATGDYYGFVDSDDYIAPDMYFCLMEAMEKYDVDIVTCNYYLDFDGELKVAENKKDVPDYPVRMEDFLKYVWERDVYKGVANYLWSKLFKKDLIKNSDGALIEKFESGFSGTDIVFNVKTGIRAKSILYISKPLYYYTQRRDSIVHSSFTQVNTLSWVEAYERILDIYAKADIKPEIIEQIQRMYVYRCGKVLEEAIKLNNSEKIDILKGKIYKYFPVYVKTNLEYKDRIKWLLDMILQ